MTLRSLIVFALLSLSSALTLATESIQTNGIAHLPEQITVRTRIDELKTYNLTLTETTFGLWQDNEFVTGNQTLCDSHIGTLASEVRIPIQVAERYKYGQRLANSNPTAPRPHIQIGPVGNATLVIPEGTDVHGQCRGQGSNLDDLSLQGAGSEDKPAFKIEWNAK